jgi:murein DD-endopeptidase MepM/ murein hydrolase activator NlpD
MPALEDLVRRYQTRRTYGAEREAPAEEELQPPSGRDRLLLALEALRSAGGGMGVAQGGTGLLGALSDSAGGFLGTVASPVSGTAPVFEGPGPFSVPPVPGAVIGWEGHSDFGVPRPGGRTHQGNDLFAPEGTPVYATFNGFAERSDNSLGGIAVSLNAPDGGHTYNAHLSSSTIPERGRRVRAGEVIGYVGTSGNARGGPPHVHFEYHPPGSSAIDPWSMLQAIYNRAKGGTPARPQRPTAPGATGRLVEAVSRPATRSRQQR